MPFCRYHCTFCYFAVRVGAGEALMQRYVRAVANPEVLGKVHRGQTMAQALAACELLAGSGLIVNVDLIYGLPGQTEAIFREDIAAVAGRGRPGVDALQPAGERAHAGHPRARRRGALRPRAARAVASFVKHCAEELGYSQTRWHTFKRMESAARTHQWLPTFDDSMSGHQLGVGMSARSQICYTVYRNLDRLEPYMDRVEARQSPGARRRRG